MAEAREEIGAAFEAFSSAATDGMYQMILARLNGGHSTEVGGIRTFVMTAARLVRDRSGKLTTVAELKQFAGELMGARRHGAAAVNAVLSRWVPGWQAPQPAGSPASAPAAPAPAGGSSGGGGAELRPNALLDDAFAAPAPTAAAPAGAAQLRPNALLDEAFGTGSGVGPLGAGGEAPIPLAAGPLPRARDPYDVTPTPGADAPIPLADGMPPRPAARDVYDVRPPERLPGRPNTPLPGTGLTRSGTGGLDPVRLLREIRDGVLKLVERAAGGGSGVGPPGPSEPPPPPNDPRYGLGDAINPVTSWLRGTKVGRIGERAWSRLKPAIKAMRGARRGAKGARGSKGPIPRGGVRPPIPPAAGGTAAAAGAGGAGGAAAGGAAAAASVAVPVIGAVVAATAALIELAKAGVELARQQEGRARELAAYNVTQAAAVAQLDVGRIRRGIESGEATANSASTMLGAENRFEDAARPFTDAADTIKNLIGGAVMEVLTDLLNTLKPLAETVNDYVEKLYGPRADSVTVHDQLRRGQQDYEQRQAAARVAAAAARRAGGR